MSPAIANAITALKPTVGLVSRDKILPISHIQDTAGPMARNVEDMALLLSAIAGRDENDAATYTAKVKDYVGALSEGIRGTRAGLITFKDVPMNEDTQAAFDRLKQILSENGCETREIEYDVRHLNDYPLLKYEFKNDLERYLAAHGSRMRLLSEIIQFNKDHADRCLPHGQDILEESETASGQLKEADYLKQRLELDRKAHEMIDGIMDQYQVDVLIYAAGHVMTNFSAVSGNPSLTLPAVSQSGEPFVPISYYLMARAYEEDILIRFAKVIESGVSIVCRPAWSEEKYW